MVRALPPIRDKRRTTGAFGRRSVGSVTKTRLRLGAEGERIAARELERRGFRIIARNARPAAVRGELDIVALDGDVLVFVEVKTGSAGTRRGPASMLEMVGPKKRAKLRALAGAWLRQHRGELPPMRAIRIDVVGIRIDAAGRVTSWDHVCAAC